MEPEGSLPQSQQPPPVPTLILAPPSRLSKINFNIILSSTPEVRLYRRISLVPMPLCMIRNKFLRWVVRTSPNPQVDHPLSAVRDYIFNIFAATLHICRPFLLPQPEDAPCRCDRDPLITMTGTHLSLWQGPTYHYDRNPLITVTGTHLSLWQGPTYHCDRDPRITVTGTHLSLWQGPTYHCDRDPRITVTGTHVSLWKGPTYHCDRDPRITMTGTHLSLWQGPTYHYDRNPIITVTGTHLSLWQGPTYHYDRDPLITVTGTHLSLTTYTYRSNTCSRRFVTRNFQGTTLLLPDIPPPKKKLFCRIRRRFISPNAFRVLLRLAKIVNASVNCVLFEWSNQDWDGQDM
jgi:hypothetical protein